MPLLDRFRPRPEWQHRDAEVRIAAVRHLGPDQQQLLANIARSDVDVRVRRVAAKKLRDPALLAELARSDADEGVRQDASEILLGLALEGESAPLAEAALAGLADSRHLVSVARSARQAPVREAALRRLTDPRALAAVAKGAEDPALRLAALQAISDPAVLADLALKCEHKDVAMAAASRIDDRETLEAVAARGRNKAAARRARSLLDAMAGREPAPVEPSSEAVPYEPPPDRPDAASEDHDQEAQRAHERAARVALCETVESLAGEDAPRGLEEARSAWEPLPRLLGPEGEALARRFEEACAACRTRHERWTAGRAWRARLEAVCSELERVAETAGPTEARTSAGALRTEWARLLSEGDVEAELEKRVLRAEARLAEREARAREDGARQRKENLARLESLCGRLEALARSDALTLRDAERGLRDVKAALDSLGPLPGKRDRQAILARLRSARAALFPRAQELREADEWTRWANVSQQEELCRRAEGLLEAQDLEEAARQLRDLDARWKEVRQAPKEEAEALWRRFRTARDEVRSRCDAYFARKAGEQAACLERKEALCEEAEALAESTDWLRTAETLRRLQEEWKRIGPIPRRKSKALWARFRKACDRFFERRKKDLDRRKEEWAKNLLLKEALCEKVEALVDSTDWDRAAAEIRRLQAEWKTIGPVRRNRAEAVWKRFRHACDAFFARYQQRDSLERAAREAAREALCRELEELGELEEAPEDLAGRVQDAIARWRQVDPVSTEPAPLLSERFARARDRLVETRPDRFRGTELDPEGNRATMETLCARVEALLPASPGDGDVAAFLVNRLREALAANTLGGRGEAESRWRTMAAEVEAAQQAWTRLGPVPGAGGQALQERFQRACQRFFEQRPRATR